jgi:hypothetical protein
MLITIGSAQRGTLHHPIHRELRANMPGTSVLTPSFKKATEKCLFISQASTLVAFKIGAASGASPLHGKKRFEMLR